MMKRIAGVLATIVLSACGGTAAIKNKLAIEFSGDPSRVRVTATTEISRGAEFGNDAVARRVASARQAIAESRDEWSVRFAATAPQEERRTIDKYFGDIDRVEQSGVIDRSDLTKFFSDLAMTVSLTRGDGWTELAVYPNASTRATRQQRERVMERLEIWSRDSAQYIDAASNLYRYLDANPRRAETVFRLMLGTDDEKSTIDEEQALIDRVQQTMNTITSRLQQDERNEYTMDEEFDLVFNPFPAEITVKTPRAFLLSEGFDKRADDLVAIHRTGLPEAVEAFEGKWISPDLIGMSLREDKIDPKRVAAMPRKSSTIVTPSEIAKTITDRLKPAGVYRVRWVE